LRSPPSCNQLRRSQQPTRRRRRRRRKRKRNKKPNSAATQQPIGQRYSKNTAQKPNKGKYCASSMNDFNSEKKTKVYGNTNPHPCFCLKIARSSCDLASSCILELFFFAVATTNKPNQEKCEPKRKPTATKLVC
jgi:hypothetical protein